MDRENITLQLNADVIKKLNLYAELDKKSQSDLINELLDSALNNYFLMRTGGMVLTVPNPQFYHINKDKAKAGIDQILETACYCTHANLHTGMLAVANFMETRLFIDNESVKERFKNNLIANNK